jgi:hypothetical protein
MDYKPYTIEWSRKRYLNEAIQKYLEDDCSAEIILGDIIDILEQNFFKHKNSLDKIENILKNLSN